MPCIGIQRRRKNDVRLMRFVGSSAVERLKHLLSAVGQFIAKCRPHLEDAVRKAEFENVSGDRRISALVPQVDLLPCLRSTGLIFHHTQCLRILGRKRHRPPFSKYSDKPSIATEAVKRFPESSQETSDCRLRTRFLWVSAPSHPEIGCFTLKRTILFSPVPYLLQLPYRAGQKPPCSPYFAMKNRCTSLLVALLEIAGLSGATVAIQLVTAAANLFVPFACSADSQPTILAQGARNVRDYGAVGDGVTDDTQAFLRALQIDRDLQPLTTNPRVPQDLYNKRGASVYVPPGTYLLCATVALWGGTHFFGEPRNWPTLKLKDRATGFGTAPHTPLDFNVNNPGSYNPNQDPATGNVNPLITVVNGYGTVNGHLVSNNWYQYSGFVSTNPEKHPNGSTNNTFAVYMENFILDLGHNPGAIGISWNTAQQSALRNIIINAANAFGGVQTALGGGGGVITNVEVDGGRVGIYYFYTSQELFRSCKFKNQKEYSLVISPALASGAGAFIDMQFDNTGPVVTYDAFCTNFYDCQFTNMPGPSYVYGYGGNAGRYLHVENLSFDAVSTVPSFMTAFLSGGVVSNYQNVSTIYNGSALTADDPRNSQVVLGKPYEIREMPLPSCACVNVTTLGVVPDGLTDNTTAIQSALNRYKELYFPGGVYLVSDTLTVPAGSRLWMGKSLMPNQDPFAYFSSRPPWGSTNVYSSSYGIYLIPGSSHFSDPNTRRPLFHVIGEGTGKPTYISGFAVYHYAPGGIPLVWEADQSSAMFDSHFQRFNDQYAELFYTNSTNEARYRTALSVSNEPTIRIKSGGYIENAECDNGCPVLGDANIAGGFYVTSTEPLWLYTIQPEHYTHFGLVLDGASNVTIVHTQYERALPPFVPAGWSAGTCPGTVQDFSQFMMLKSSSNIHISNALVGAHSPDRSFDILVQNCHNTRIFAADGWISTPMIKEIVGGTTTYYNCDVNPDVLATYMGDPSYPCTAGDYIGFFGGYVC